MKGQWKLVWMIGSDSEDASTLAELLGVSVHDSCNRGDVVTDDVTGAESIHPYTVLFFGGRTGKPGERIEAALYNEIEEIQSLKRRLKHLKGPYRLDLHCYLRNTDVVSLGVQLELITLLKEVGAGIFVSLDAAPNQLPFK